jgi:hypothetical protein
MTVLKIRVSDEVLTELAREAFQNETTVEYEAVLAIQRGRLYKLIIDHDGVNYVCENTSAWKK